VRQEGLVQLRLRCLWFVLVFCAALPALGCATAATAAETARGQWYEVRSPRFQLWTDADPALARSLVEDLERYHQVMLATTTVEEREAAPPLRIFLAKNGASFNALLSAKKMAPGAIRSGVFRPTYRGNYAIVDAEETGATPLGMTARSILFHEYAHYVLAMQGVQVPSLYNEGFAEYMSTTAFAPNGSYSVGCPPLYRTAYREHVGWIPMRRVMEADDVADLLRGETGFVRTRRAATDSYLQSWYMVHYFASDAPRKHQMQEYLRLWAAGTPTEQATQSAFGMTSAQLDVLLQQEAQRPSMDCLSIKPAHVLAIPPVEVRPLSTAAAQYHVGDLLLSTLGPTDVAIEILIAATRTDDPHALASLARAHWMRAETDGAEIELGHAQVYLERAMKRAPNDPELFALAGHIARLKAIRVRARDAGAAGREIARARTNYRKAIRADETLSEAYFGLGETYLIDDTGSAEAETVLEAAAFLLPLDTEVVWDLAQLYAHRGHPDKAIAAFEYVLHWAQSDKQRESARAALKTLHDAAGP
jgi:hypothetical protein